MRCQNSLHQARGAALIIALMVVALVAVIGASMGLEYAITVRRASNQLVGEQAYSYALAAETIAVKALRLDLLKDAQLDGGTRHDSLDEFWAKDVPPFQTAEGAYGGKLIDLSGRFNLNSLRMGRIQKNPQNVSPELIQTVNEARFVRLLESLSDDEEGEFIISEQDAIPILEALLDWLDVDNEPTGFGGAEDDYYANIEGRPAYRAANGPMVSTSELLLLKNMTPEIYKRLLPHVTVWPAEDNGTSIINVNTATENVLRALNVGQKPFEGFQPATREQVASLVELQQKETGLGDEKEMQAALKSIPGYNNIDTSGLGIASDFFLLDGHVTLGDVATHMQSVISRKDGQVQVIMRSSGGL